jgi:hypothetical protein
MSRAELEKRILRLHKGRTGMLKIGKTLGIGTGTVQRVLMEQPRDLDRVGQGRVSSAMVRKASTARRSFNARCASTPV